MAHHQVRIAQLGTFDVANYGDLLFPLLARRRLGFAFPDLLLDVVSPVGGEPLYVDAAPVLSWPDFAARIDTYDAILVGGGNIIRLNPTDLAAYREGLTPLLAYARLWAVLGDLGSRVVPVLWNAPGVPVPLPAELLPELRQALAGVRYMAVRDERSREHAEPLATRSIPAVVPDTAWDLPLLWSHDELAEGRLGPWRRSGRDVPARSVAVHLNRRYLSGESAGEVAARLDVLARERDATLVLVAIGPCHGDDELAREIGAAMQTAPLVLDAPRSLMEMAAVIAGAEFYLGSSMHGFITAIAFGVPGLIVGPATTKFDGLLAGLGLPELRGETWAEALDLVAQSRWQDILTRAEAGIAVFRPQLNQHWDRIYEEISLSLVFPHTMRRSRTADITPVLLGHIAIDLLQKHKQSRGRLAQANAGLRTQKLRHKNQLAKLTEKLNREVARVQALKTQRDEHEKALMLAKQRSQSLELQLNEAVMKSRH